MSELIKREDVQREIQTSFDGGAFRWQDGQDLMDRINALPTASPWHRVEEELPKYTGRCIVWCGVNWHGEGMHGDVMIARYDRNKQRWHVEADSSLAGPLVGDVLYWMPIEPPKEDV